MLFVTGVAAFGLVDARLLAVGCYWVAALLRRSASGFCVAEVTVAGNTYVAETVDDEIRGRVFTAMESVIRVALLLSMVVIAPLGDLVSGRRAPVRSRPRAATRPSWC